MVPVWVARVATVVSPELVVTSDLASRGELSQGRWRGMGAVACPSADPVN